MKRSWIVLLIVLLLAACAGSPAAEPAPAPPAEAVASPTSQPAAPLPSATPEPVSAEPTVPDPTPPAPAESPEPAAQSLLPRDLYFLAPGADDTSQIWRLSADGSMAMLVTGEPGGISDFDVSPVDGSLAYVRNEESELVRAAPDGSSPTLLYRKSAEDDPGNPLLPVLLRNVRWSPDGSQIAFGLNGVNLIPAAGGERQLVLASDPPPDPNGGRGSPILLYSPHSWSPDGSAMLISVAYYPEGGYFALLDPASGTVTELGGGSAGSPCCSPTWSAGGKTILFGNNQPGMLDLGLWEASTTSGTIRPLGGEVDPMSSFPPVMVGFPKGAGDTVYGWRNTLAPGATVEEVINQTPVLQRAPLPSASDPAAWEMVNNDPLRLREALWSDDGSGVVAAAMDDTQGWDPGGAELLWISTNDGEMIPLGARGHTLRWGPTARGGE